MTNTEDHESVLAAYRAHAERFGAIAAKRARRPGPRAADVRLAVLDGPGELTAREFDVLTLLSDGHANGEIGRRLFISEETVKTHVRRILMKLAARNRAHAVGLAFRRGLVAALPIVP